MGQFLACNSVLQPVEAWKGAQHLYSTSYLVLEAQNTVFFCFLDT